MLRAARKAGKAALDNTPELLPVLKDAGVVDAGGAGFLLLLDSALHVVGRRAAAGARARAARRRPGRRSSSARSPTAARAVDGELDVSELRYEVMYFCELADARIDEFKRGWGEIGDSIVVVGGDGLWNCHVHTNDIGAAIEVALDVGGRPKQIRVTDLFEEVADEHAHRTAGMRQPRCAPAATGVRSRAGGGLPAVTCAVVAVCSGDGLAELFSNLGVQGVVTGGQTMNPSTAELLDTVEHVNADQVVILPNNKNIIPVAQQVDALTSKTVVVVPTRSMPEALAALVVYDPEASGADNGAEMTTAAESVATGEVTRAVRDTNSEVGPINEGDWIGIVRGDGIVSVAADARRRGDGAARPPRRAGARDRHDDHRRRRQPVGHRCHRGMAGRRARRRAGRGAPRRPAAVPVPVRRGVTRRRVTGPITLRELAEIDVGRLRGVGERKRDALSAFGIETVLDLRHHVSAPLGRPHQRGPHRRPAWPATRRSCWSPCGRSPSACCATGARW